MVIWFLNSKILLVKLNFSDQFKNTMYNQTLYKKVAYKMDIRRLSALLVVKSIVVYSYDFLFICTAVSQASDSMMTLM